MATIFSARKGPKYDFERNYPGTFVWYIPYKKNGDCLL